MQSLKDVIPSLLERVQTARDKARNETPTPKKLSGDALPIYDCSKCKDQGGFFTKHPVEMMVKGEVRTVTMDHWLICECMERKKLQRLLKGTNMSEDAQHKTFDNFILDGADPRVVAAYELAREYSDGLVARIKRGQSLKGVPWFGLLGTSGSGKTHLVTAAVAPLIELGVHPLFFNWVQSFQEWFAYYSKTDEAYMVEEIRQKIYNCELLVVDDICKESQRDNWIREFYGIIDYRYRKQLPIVYTSEYFHQLIGFLSEATAGRLFEKTKSPKGKKFLGKMLLGEGEDPLALNYRFKELLL